MKAYVAVVLALVVGLISNLAHARKLTPPHPLEPTDYINKELPDDAVVWHCWYAGNAVLKCRLGESDGVVAPTPTVDARLPPVVGQIWHRAAELAQSIVSIPLYAIPFDMALTGQLAESVMCGGTRKPCGIIFAENLALLSVLVGQRNLQLAARRMKPLAMGAMGGDWRAPMVPPE